MRTASDPSVDQLVDINKDHVTIQEIICAARNERSKLSSSLLVESVLADWLQDFALKSKIVHLIGCQDVPDD
jgi:hypothetical protein